MSEQHGCGYIHMIISMANDGDNRRIMENDKTIPGGRGHTDDDGPMVMKPILPEAETTRRWMHSGW